MDITDSMNQNVPQTEVENFPRTSVESVHALDNIKRRSSSRSIKRRKFDDELVESSLNVGSTAGFGPKVARTRTPSMSTTSTVVAEPGVTNMVAMPVSVSSPSTQVDNKPRRSTGKSSSRRNRKVKQPYGSATKDLGRWKPTDDLALITNIQQTNDMRMVHRGIKFSCRFTLQEIQQRWYALLYDAPVSRLAVAAMRNLNAEVIANVESKALYSKAEEEILGTVKASSQPTLETFQELLIQNPQVFYHTRTPKALMTHWHLMKQYHLLPDQSVQSLPRGDHVLSFTDAEDMINDAELVEMKDSSLDQELALADRRSKKEIRTIESELGRWQVLVDSVIGVTPPDFDNQTLAVLRGRLVRYLMRSREITIGRSTRDHSVDVDLTLEGPAWKVSRRQGTIRLRNNGDFYLASEGKRAIYVDGRPILAGNKYRLNNNSVVEIASLRFIFLVNQDLINAIREEAAKLNLQTSKS